MCSNNPTQVDLLLSNQSSRDFRDTFGNLSSHQAAFTGYFSGFLPHVDFFTADVFDIRHQKESVLLPEVCPLNETEIFRYLFCRTNWRTSGLLQFSCVWLSCWLKNFIFLQKYIVCMELYSIVCFSWWSSTPFDNSEHLTTSLVCLSLCCCATVIRWNELSYFSRESLLHKWTFQQPDARSMQKKLECFFKPNWSSEVWKNFASHFNKTQFSIQSAKSPFAQSSSKMRKNDFF